MSAPGQIFCVRRWDHNTPSATFSYNLGRAKKNSVAAMLFLGEQPRDPQTDAECIDVDAVMFSLGYKPIRQKRNAA